MFEKVNALLVKYHELPFDPTTCKANNEVEDNRILVELHQALEWDVCTYIAAEFHLSPAIFADQKYQRENYHVQQAKEAPQRFWERFLASLRNRRCEQRKPLQISKREYLRWLVIQVVRWRAPTCFEKLNSIIGVYFQSSAGLKAQAPSLRHEIERCCKAILSHGGRTALTAEAEVAIPIKADQLLQRFLSGTIWQTGITLRHPEESEYDLHEIFDLNDVNTRYCLLEYVNRESFRAALFGEDTPNRPGIPRTRVADDVQELFYLVHGAKTRDETAGAQEIVTEQCETLATSNRDQQAVRRLMVLLFLPWYEPKKPEARFCERCTNNGLVLLDPAKNLAKLFWANVIVQGLVQRQELVVEGAIQGLLIDLVQRNGYFSDMIKPLVSYAELECEDIACREIARDLAAAKVVLRDFWRLSIRVPPHFRPVWTNFTYCEKNQTSADVVDGEGGKPVDTRLPLVLILQKKEKNHDA